MKKVLESFYEQLIGGVAFVAILLYELILTYLIALFVWHNRTTGHDRIVLFILVGLFFVVAVIYPPYYLSIIESASRVSKRVADLWAMKDFGLAILYGLLAPIASSLESFVCLQHIAFIVVLFIKLAYSSDELSIYEEKRQKGAFGQVKKRQDIDGKANTERYVQRLVKMLERFDIPLTFGNLIKYFDADELRLLNSKAYKEKRITKEEHYKANLIISSSAEIAMDASARFSNVAESDLGKIFADDGIDISTAIKENAIILFILNPLIYPELSKTMGRLILIDAKKAVSDLYTAKKERVFFLFDEINTYASPVLIDLINKSRSANVTCIAATQSLSDLDFGYGTAFREQVIENCNTYLVMRQNSAVNAEAWADILGTKESLSITYQIGKDKTATGMGTAKKDRKYLYHPDDIKRLSTGEAIYMSKDTGEHARIFVRKGF